MQSITILVSQRTTSSYQNLVRHRVISLNLTNASHETLVDGIMMNAAHRRSRTVCFANVHMVVEAHLHSTVASAVNKADWAITDGMPLVWAIKSLYGLKQDRVAGMDMILSLLDRAEKENISIFFYGCTPDVLQRVRQFCLHNFPSIKIAGTISPPFRALTDAEEKEVIETINNSGAGLVFVALGCPKQELWMEHMKHRIQAVMLGIGGALPMLIGEKKRAPKWIQRIGFEWLFRLVQEPRRLFKRYAVTNTLFVYFFLKQLITQRS
ncbi:WecB/TagA/CpsF family glycosyltransferase [Fibrisoma limi]|uniref:WecB/TagA/CpsF family glycosyltransferase n=1 Tax=Fibrisoma limi TaxID=663275 RepID=UPI001E57A7B2|nr:WecB/TagA/CpsF family glycosyltransferase [Fibrisoma limi]